MLPEQGMEQALSLATKAASHGEVPVGAVIVYQDQVIGRGWNQCIGLNDPSAHAEVIAIRDACRQLDNYRLNQCALYVTLEPCMMCLGAIMQARVNQVFFGAYDSKAGALGGCLDLVNLSLHNHELEHQGGMMQAESVALLSTFFQQKR